MDTSVDPHLRPLQPNQPGTIFLDLFAIEQLRETRKWTNFLSIVAFLMIGPMFIGAIVMMTGMFSSHVEGLGIGSVFTLILLTLVYSFPVYYLYQFSKFARQAVDNYDALALSQALRYLKMHYRSIASLIILLFGLYMIGGYALVSGKLVGIF